MNKRFLFFAASAVLFAACSNDDENTGANNGLVEARITANLSGPLTRAVGTNWNADHIGVMVTDAPNSNMEGLYRNVEYSTSSTGATADFSAGTGQGIFFQDATETVTFSAYAPYQTTADNATLPGTNGVINVDTENSNTPTGQESIDFLFAQGATGSRQNNTISFSDETPETSGDDDDHSFHHMMSQLNIVFQTSTTAGFNATDIFDATSFNLGGLIHTGTFSVTNGGATATGEAVASWDITACNYDDDTDNNTRTYSLILLPQSLAAPLTVAVVIGGQTYSNSNAINPTLEAGKSYTYTITVTKTGLVVSGCTITGWDGDTTGGSGVAVM